MYLLGVESQCTVFLFLIGVACILAISAEVGSDVFLPCGSSTRLYPTWTGPVGNSSGVSYNWAGADWFKISDEKKDRLAWASDQKSLVVLNVQRNDSGDYSCGFESHVLEVRVRPQDPVISNTDSSTPARLTATQDASTPLECTSRGGYPQPTVEWYRGSALLTPTDVSAVHQSDNTYTVTARYTFTPTRNDHQVMYMCRSSYSSPPPPDLSASAQLWLNLKPTQPVVTSVSGLTEGSWNENITRCTSGGFRPQTGALLKWSFKGNSRVSTTSVADDQPKDTYRFDDTYTAVARREDNGQQITCTVSHSLFPSATVGSATVSIQFAPRFANLSGTTEVVADSSQKVSLDCVTDSSNPVVSTITWTRHGQTISNTAPLNPTPGQHNGQVVTQKLEFIPTRDMDNQEVMCTVSNGISTSVSSNMEMLNLMYHPQARVSGPNQPITQGDSFTLTCTVSSKPASTVKWYHGATFLAGSSESSPGVFKYTVTNVGGEDYGTYRCVATNGLTPNGEDTTGNVIIKFAPKYITMSGETSAIAVGTNKVRVTCLTDLSYPESVITWKLGDSTIANSGHVTKVDGQYGGKTVSQTLEITPTPHMDGVSVTCSAANEANADKPVVDANMLDITFCPLVDNMANQEVVEGSTVSLICDALTKPSATFRWYRDSNLTPLEQGGGTTVGKNKERRTYTVKGVQRGQTGTYRCMAENGVGNCGHQGSKTVEVTVQYPPDVTVGNQTTTTNHSVTMQCTASGVPHTSYKYRWLQIWPGFGKVAEWYDTTRNTRDLVIDTPTYQHGGIYICAASNGIKVFGTDREFMEGSGTLHVKSQPIHVDPEPGKVLRISAELNVVTTIAITYYSNTGDSLVSCTRGQYIPVASVEIQPAVLKETHINLPVNGQIVTTLGMEATIDVKITHESGFGEYVINITNEIAIASIQLELSPLLPPLENPTDITIRTICEKSAIISWIPGYHGGRDQTFVIQISTDNIDWANASSAPGGMDISGSRRYRSIDGLVSGAKYYVRVFAYNANGRSKNSDNVEFVTQVHSAEVAQPQADVVIIGGSVGAVASIACVALVVVVVLWRRNVASVKSIKGNARGIDRHKPSDIQSQHGHVYDNDVVQPQGHAGSSKSNNPYEQLTDNRSNTSTAYETLELGNTGESCPAVQNRTASSTYEQLQSRNANNEYGRLQKENKDTHPKEYENLKV